MSVNTKRPVDSKAVRMDKKTREAQARLADKSFTQFMREHNARVYQKIGA